MKFGEAVVYDFRNGDSVEKIININEMEPTFEDSQYDLNNSLDIGSLSVVQWNIERGYQLEKIIKLLSECNADIICLQELDINCIRSHRSNCALEIARQLKMKCICVVEFEELNEQGVHGNAILSKMDFDLTHVIMHSQVFNWNEHGKSRGESRIGQRCTMVCEFKIKNVPILVYSAHLEVFTGILGRITQLSEIFSFGSNSDRKHQILCGDLNTLGHGIARFSPNYCNDEMRWKSIGYAESEFFYDRVLKFNVSDGPFNESLQGYGLSKEIVEAARNPGFNEVFDLSDITLTNYGGAFQGKLDWLMIKGFGVKHKYMKNNDFDASDHKLLYATLTSLPFQDPNKDVVVKRNKARIYSMLVLSSSVLIVALILKIKNK